MAEYIDRDEVIAWIWKQKRLSKVYTVMVIQDLPAADVEPVVRCPECKYHHDCGTHFCDRLGMDCPDDSEFFCKYGARMGGAE